MSDDKFLHDSGILCGSFFTRRRLWVTDGRAGWLSGEGMRCMQDTFLPPGAKGRGRLVFVGGFFPRRQETGTGPVLPEEAASTSRSRWRGQKFPIMCVRTHTHTQNTAGCVFINRGAHIHK